MEISGLLPYILVALVAFVVLRMIAGAIKSSVKMAFWAVIAVVVLGAGFLWYQGQGEAGTSRELPALSIPSSQP